MNVFVLNTGRCGSVTFVKACSHITNYSSGHETRCRLVGDERLAYPARHIEADNRLSWLLGRLDRAYGNNAFYVHLVRNASATAKSLSNRFHSGMMRAYYRGVLMSPDLSRYSPMQIAFDYCETVNCNIEQFLKDKNNVMRFELEQSHEHFRAFWKAIQAEGDLDAALAEWNVRHNPTTWRDTFGTRRRTLLRLLRIPRFRSK